MIDAAAETAPVEPKNPTLLKSKKFGMTVKDLRDALKGVDSNASVYIFTLGSGDLAKSIDITDQGIVLA